jgi:hypothetical protein
MAYCAAVAASPVASAIASRDRLWKNGALGLAVLLNVINIISLEVLPDASTDESSAPRPFQISGDSNDIVKSAWFWFGFLVAVLHMLLSLIRLIANFITRQQQIVNEFMLRDMDSSNTSSSDSTNTNGRDDGNMGASSADVRDNEFSADASMGMAHGGASSVRLRRDNSGRRRWHTADGSSGDSDGIEMVDMRGGMSKSGSSMGMGSFDAPSPSPSSNGLDNSLYGMESGYGGMGGGMGGGMSSSPREQPPPALLSARRKLEEGSMSEEE